MFGNMSVEYYENYCRSNKINIDQNILTALARSCTTREVSLGGVTINTQNCEALGSVISSFDVINKLDLSNSLLPIPGLCLLFDKLTNCHLSTLNLKGNNIYGNATLRLGRLLSKNTSIKVLLLEWNNVGTPIEAFSKFCHALINNRTLQVLDLKNNELDADCAFELSDVLVRNTYLKEVDLRWNSIGIEGGQNLLKSLTSNNVINVLHIQGNNIPSDMISAIDNTVKHNHTVQKISAEYAARHDLLTRQINDINKKRVDDLNTACEQGVQQLQPCLDKIKEYSIQKQKLIEQLEEGKLKILQLEEVIVGLRVQLESANKQVDIKQKVIIELEKTINTIREQAETDIDLVKSNFVKEEKRLSNEIKTFQSTIEKEKESRVDLEKKLSESQFAVESLIKETEELKERLNRITCMHNKVIEEERRVHQEALQNQAKEFHKQQTQTNEHFDKIKLENSKRIEMLEMKLADLEHSKQALNELILTEKCSWNEEKTRLVTEFSEKQAEILKSNNQRLNQVRQEKALVEKELLNNQGLFRTLMTESDSMKSEIAQYTNKISVLQSELTQSKIALENVYRDQSQASKLEGTFKNEADKYKTELIEARQMISDLQIENNSLTDKHRAEVNDLNNRLQIKVEEICKMRTEEMERAQALYGAINKYISGRW